MGAAESIFVCPETSTRILDHLSPGPKLEQHDEEWTPAYVKMEVERERRVRQRALARVAQVCRAISERALDRLWGELWECGPQSGGIRRIPPDFRRHRYVIVQ